MEEIKECVTNMKKEGMVSTTICDNAVPNSKPVSFQGFVFLYLFLFFFIVLCC